MAKKYQKSVFFRRQNSQKSEKNLAKASKNCRKIRSKTFLKGGADRAGVILKGRAAGSSGPPIFRGGWAVAAVIGAALSSLKVVAGCCRFAAGGWCRAGSVAAGRRLSILYGVGCHWWRWASLSILYSSKVGRASVIRQAQNAQKAGAGRVACPAFCVCPIWFYSLSPWSSAAGSWKPSRFIRSSVAVKIYFATLSPAFVAAVFKFSSISFGILIDFVENFDKYRSFVIFFLSVSGIFFTSFLFAPIISNFHGMHHAKNDGMNHAFLCIS